MPFILIWSFTRQCVQEAACSWTPQEVFKGTPWDDQAVDKPVSSALSAGDKTPRNLWKVPERSSIQVFKKKKKDFGFLSPRLGHHLVGMRSMVAG